MKNHSYRAGISTPLAICAVLIALLLALGAYTILGPTPLDKTENRPETKKSITDELPKTDLANPANSSPQPVPNPTPPSPTPDSPPATVKIGDRVKTTSTINVTTDPLTDPAMVLGTQPIGAKGKITNGPRNVGGTSWWYVNFDNASDGYVPGSQLLHIPISPPSPSPSPKPSPTPTPPPPPVPTPTPVPTPVPTPTPQPSTKTFTVTGNNFSFSPSEIRVKKGDTVKINFSNANGTHDWVVDEFNIRTPVLSGGQTASVEFVASKTGTFEYYCSIGSHRAMGMVGKLIVE